MDCEFDPPEVLRSHNPPPGSLILQYDKTIPAMKMED